MGRKSTRLILILGILGATFAFFYFGGNEYFTLSYLKAKQEAFHQYYAAHPIQTIALYMAIYIISVALSFPGATVITLAGGALFGLWVGTLIVSFASTIGASLAFLASRFVLKDWVQKKFKSRLQNINEGVKKDGGFYLFTLRLIPAVPFFLINLSMALTPMKLIPFFWISQIGMLPGTMVYVNAGTQLGQIESLRGILSPELIFSFVLLGIFPWIARKILDFIKAKRAFAGYKKPKRFDYNVVVIGAGSAGLVSSYIAATVRAKVALIEKNKMGGDCLNTGCVPSKALIKSAKIFHDAKRVKDFGFKKAEIEFDFADLMDRVQSVIKTIEPHDSVERYTKLGVECISGTAKIKSPFEVEVNGRVLTTRAIVLAAGAEPLVPPIPGLDSVSYYTSDTLWDLRKQPGKMVVLGGGPIGCELAQCFQRLGSKVTLVEMLPVIMNKEDPEISEAIRHRMETEGMDVRTGYKAVRFEKTGEQKTMVCEFEGKEVKIEFDALLVALGRKPRTKGYGLETLGIDPGKGGVIETDEYLRTRFPNIYVCGDLAGPYQFTHTAAHTAWFATVNALFSPLKTFKVDYRVIPWATFTDPEVARVGLNETEAKEKGMEYDITTYGLDDLDRAIADSENHGVVKVLTQKGSDKILGATIVGDHASNLITEFINAMKQGFGMNAILGTIHIYPTWSEANKFAAGNWKKARKPEKLLSWVEKFHRFRRGGRS